MNSVAGPGIVRRGGEDRYYGLMGDSSYALQHGTEYATVSEVGSLTLKLTIAPYYYSTHFGNTFLYSLPRRNFEYLSHVRYVRNEKKYRAG
jgi:hypothetical protein